MSARPLPGQAGIGLIEFLVSLLILTIIITGTMALQLTSLRTTTESRASALAITIAQSRLEELRSMSAARACASGTTTYACFDYEGVPTTTGDSSTACSNYFVRRTEFTLTPPTCDIKVIVAWTGQTGPQWVTQAVTRAP